ncbi:PAS domain S-box protein [Draconibacterium sediminis]|uniref:PAS domain S-box protein n=1 Tax=Draconibacterium sediminis TaxID=1544798 RepID=UPI00069671A3|nr:PAS domain S-box protein [Draconibacterium sediminis]
MKKRLTEDMNSHLNVETLDFLPWAVMTLSTEMKVLYANAAARSALDKIGANTASFPAGVKWINQRGAPLSTEEHPVAQCINRREPLSGVMIGAVLPSDQGIVWLETHCIPEMKEGSQPSETVIFTFVTKEQSEAGPETKYCSSKPGNKLEVLTTALDNLNEAILVISHEGTVVYTNRGYAELFKPLLGDMLDWTYEQMTSAFDVYDSSGQLLAPEQWPSARIFNGETVFQEKMKVSPKDNSFSRFVQISGGPVKLSENLGHFYILSACDITDQEQNLQLLQKNEKSYRKLFLQNPQPMWIYDLETLSFLEVNDATLSKYGYSREEFMNMSIRDIRQKVNVPKLLKDIERTSMSLNNAGEWRHRKKNGELIDVEVISYRLTYQGRKARLVMPHDITDRKKAEKLLAESEERLSLFIQHAPASLAMFDRDMTYLAVSNKWLDNYQLSGKDFIGMSHYDVFPDITDEWKALHQRGLNGEIIRDDDDIFVRHDGTIQYLKWEIRPWLTADKQVGGIIIFTEDITERKRAEEALQRNEALLNETGKIAKIGGWELNCTTMQQVWTDETFAIHDREKSKYNPNSNEELSRFEPGSKELIEPAFEAALTKGLPYDLEVEMTTVKGTRKWVRAVCTPILTDGKVSKLKGMVQDITKRKQAERKLIKSEENFRNLFFDSPDAYLLIKDGTFIECNKAAEKMLSGPRSDILGKTPAMLSPEYQPDGRKSVVYAPRLIKETYRKGKNSFEWVHKTLDSIEFIAQVNLSIVEISGEKIVFTSWQDITERKQAEEKLFESEKRFATIFEDSPIAIALSSVTDGKIIMVNPSATDLFGLTTEEIIGHSTTELGLWANQEELQHFLETLSSGKQVSGMEAVLRLKSGEKREVLIWGESIVINNEPCMMAQIIDISERKEAEEQLREREAELSNAQDLAQMASWRYDFATNQQTVSENYAKLFGFDETEAVTFEHFLSRVHPDDAWNMNPDNYSFSPDAPPIVFDFRFNQNDGSVKWIQSNMVPDFKNGQLVALKGTNIDITDKKNREEEIRLQNEKLNAIINSLPDKLFVHDSEGTFLEAYTTNPDGYIVPVNKFMGKNLSDVFPKKVAELNMKHLRECLETKELITHEFSVDYKGIYSHFEVRIVPFLDDKAIRFVRDITQKKKDEQQLENYRLRLEELVEQRTRELRISQDKLLLTQQMTKLGSWEFHPEANKAIWSEETYRIFERDPQNEAYTLDEFIASMVLKYREKAHRKIMKSIQKKKSVELNTKHITEKGNIRYLKVNGQAVLKNSEVDFFIGSMLDVTQEKLNQKKLNAAVKSAIAANKAKSIFLANMSHEIRTPLNSIIGFSELLYNSVNDDKKRSQIESIRNSGRILLNIINDILDLSKVEAGKIVIQHEQLEVFKIVCEVGGMFEQKVAEKKLGLTIESLTDLIVPLMIDETRLRQILFNLVGNAVKFTEQGKIAIYIHHEEKKNGLVDLQIRIKDTGIGIPEDQLDVIFEPFVQQQGQVQRNYGGTGLGLAISRRMAEAMGGRIDVQSVPGEGSEFTVLLKNVVKAEVQSVEKTDHQPDYSNIRLDGNTVLVVDDIADNRKLLLDVLAPTGAHLLEAENGAKAVRLAREKQPDLILMDLRMPVMDGLAAAQLLKESPETASIPCVAVSASIKLGSAQSAIPEHFEEYLMKPVAFGQLFDILLRYLSHSKKKTESGTGKSEISEEAEKEWPQALKQFAENELVPLFHHVMKTQLVDEMEDFGKQLVVAGTRFDDEMLINMGNKLIEYADLFEVDKLTQTMHEFQFVFNRKLK